MRETADGGFITTETGYAQLAANEIGEQLASGSHSNVETAKTFPVERSVSRPTVLNFGLESAPGLESGQPLLTADASAAVPESQGSSPGLVSASAPEETEAASEPSVAQSFNPGTSAPLVSSASNLGTLAPSALTTDNNQLTTNQHPILRVENLNVHFPIRKGFFNRKPEFVRAVDGVSFDVYPGETVGLVGESGCGKTTLGRALLRLVEPTSGSILFEGEDLAKLPAEQLRCRRREFQMVFQDPYAALNPMMTVGEAILEPMRVHNVGGSRQEQKARVLELLRTVGLTEAQYQRYPHEFSGGQRQRICIARALALQPKCIICDESVSALDVSVQAQVLNLLNDLKREFGITYLFITHDLSVARFMSDRLLVMRQGQIVESGPAADIYANPQHEYTKQLLAAIPKDTPADIRAAVASRV